MSTNSYQEYYPSASMVPPISSSNVNTTSSNSHTMYANTEAKQLPSISIVNQQTQQPLLLPRPPPPSLIPSSGAVNNLNGSSANLYHYPTTSTFLPPNEYFYSYNNYGTTYVANPGVNASYAPPATSQRIIGAPMGYLPNSSANGTLPIPNSNLPNAQNGYGYHTYGSGSPLHPILPSTQAPHGRNGYPISPVSIHDITRDATSSASSTSSSSVASNGLYPGYHSQGSSNLPIDYSSIVSYTISPSLKRKRRRRKQSLEVDPATGAAGSETYPCEVCDKVFLKPYNLKSHMKTHSLDKPFKCSHCFKTFARSHDKKRHELLHNGVKNFKCEGYLQDGVTKWGCGKKFARSDALSRHFRTETGWLCIRPLMDEAKRLEESNKEANGMPIDPNNPRAVLSQGEMTPGEFLDSSSFIRRLIQSK